MTAAPSLPRAAAVIVAAGQGLRAGQGMPKQFVRWRGKPVVWHSAEGLAAAGIAPIVVVISADCEQIAAGALQGIPGIRLVHGGPARQDSVRLGLEALEADAPELVLIHDAARPIVPHAVIDRLVGALGTDKAAIPVLPVADSLAREKDGRMERAVDREALRRVQTPQAFRYADILAAHRAWTGAATAGDDAQVAQAAGMTVAMVQGDEQLHKLTYATDFAQALPPVRVGTGFDVHQLADGEELWLCGVKIENSQGLAGHSDADVAIHALVDALLGAIGAGDIGQHFPPSDPQWRGAPSHRFLEHAVSLVTDAGYGIGNIDLTLICEAPRIGPHRETMRQSLANILKIGSDLVSVKATTTEKLGFTGRGEGIAAQAVATLFRI